MNKLSLCAPRTIISGQKGRISSCYSEEDNYDTDFDDIDRPNLDDVCEEKPASDKGDDVSGSPDEILEQLKRELEDDTPEEDAAEANIFPTAWEKLQAMIGLDRVKSEIEEASTLALFFKQRKELGFGQRLDCRHHMLFMGNPGTGKTTVAGLIGTMYHEMGFLSKGHTIFANRAQLVGEYIGEAEQNVREYVEQARGGVLFIDEAYTLFNGPDGKDYGKQVLNALLPFLSNDDPDLIIILAGYEDKMEEMLRYNQGLRDRFPVRLHFEDYTADQLFEMACKSLADCCYTLTPAASKTLHEKMLQAVAHRDASFGNGRWVHNFIEHGIIRAMAKRVMTTHPTLADNKQYIQIEACDVEAAARQLLSGREKARQGSRRIGFTA